MDYLNLSPPNSSLIESTKSIDYSFEEAVLDVIGSSIRPQAGSMVIEENANIKI
jgi:hypothetical protein